MSNAGPSTSAWPSAVAASASALTSPSSAPTIPRRSYPRPPRAPSPIPRFLRTLAFVLSLLVGSGAVATWIYSRFLLPRIVRSRRAKDVLIRDQSLRMEKLQEQVDTLKTVGLVRLPERESEPTQATDGEQGLAEQLSASLASLPQSGAAPPASSEAVAPPPPSDDKSASPLAPLGPLLPADTLKDLAALVGSLAPLPRPTTLTSTIRSFSSHLTSQSLMFSSRTPRAGGAGGIGLGSLGSSLDKAGGNSGGAWGGGLSDGDREVLALIGGLRGDVRGMKGLLLSRRSFPSAISRTPSPAPPA